MCPGFTRVESSGGEVNENISMRGILGVEYVNFLEDGLPVFPTMHTFFMNADNLFRIDENIERMEVVRGGASALFGSNTPGAIINLINKTGGDAFDGTMRATGATEGLARFDLNANGPLGDDWRFNVGGFYRYDHGVRDPGFPGIRGGQVKGSVTRLLSNGYVRLSAKVIDDRNQFILDLPFVNPADPQYVSGFGDYGSFNSAEGLDLRVPIPTGDLKLPLDNGLRTSAQWFTADVGFDPSQGLAPPEHRPGHAEPAGMERAGAVHCRAGNGLCHRDQGPGRAGAAGGNHPYADLYQPVRPDGQDPSTVQHPERPGGPGPAHSCRQADLGVPGPAAAPADLRQAHRCPSAHTSPTTRRTITGTSPRSSPTWATRPHFLDAVVTPPGGTPDSVTKNGFVNQLSGYNNGSGQTSVISGVLGGEIQLTDRLRADVGVRGEYDKFVQSSENTSTFDLDGNPATTYDNETFGNGSFRHFDRGINDWSASLGLNFKLTPNYSLYAAGARGYKMPALDEFLNATAEEQVDLFESKEVQSIEGGVKGFVGPIGFTVGGFWTKLKNVVSQGLVIDPVTGGSSWIIVPSPENKSYGTEIELVANPAQGLQLLGSATILKAELGTGAGADIGSRISGVPTSIANAAALYSIRGLQLKADWHWVDSRPVDVKAGVSLPAYNYFNFGAAYALSSGTTINLDLLNAFQGKGLEEGNPRLVTTGPVFLARPILPRRFQVSVSYDLGAAGAGQTAALSCGRGEAG